MQSRFRDSLESKLHRRGYTVDSFDCWEEALSELRKGWFDVVVCGLQQPDSNALAMLEEAARLDPELPVVLTRGAWSPAPVDPERQVSAPAVDADRDNVLLSVVDASAARLWTPSEGTVRRVGPTILQLPEPSEAERSMRVTTVMIAETLINAMEAKDEYLRGHSQRVAELAASIAEEIGLDADEVEAVRLAGRLHDVGKIGIRENVLNKPGPLTEEEFAHVKQHVRIGLEILTPLQQIGISLAYVRDHHEHWDGGGYPNGLKGEEISIGGRILSAADAFDALTSRRAYRAPLTADETVAYLATTCGQLLDATVYEALEGVVRRRHVLTYIDQVPKD